MNNRIKELRNVLGLTQKEFGDKLKVSKQAVYKWESGERTASNQVLNSIAEIFGASYLWLKDGEGEMFELFPEQEIDNLVLKYDLDDLDREIISAYVNLSDAEREGLKKILKSLLKEKDED